MNQQKNQDEKTKEQKKKRKEKKRKEKKKKRDESRCFMGLHDWEIFFPGLPTLSKPQLTRLSELY